MVDPARLDPSEGDDEALRWEGDDELGRMTSFDAPVVDDERVPRAETPSVAKAAPPRLADNLPRDRPLTLVTALFAVLFLAEAVGWILVVQGVQSAGVFATGSGVLDFVGAITRFLALVAAPLWFVATVQLTRELRMRRRVTRIGWLALGAGLLVPWPLLMGFVA